MAGKKHSKTTTSPFALTSEWRVIKYGEKRFSIWNFQMEFLHLAMWHDHDVDFVRWLHPAMWHVALESWQWIHQVAAAPCNVTRSSGIMTLSSPGGSTLQCGRWLWDDMPLNSPKRRILEFYTWFRFQPITAVDMSFCTSLWNMIQIEPSSAEKNDVMSLFEKADLSHRQ